MKTFLAIIGFMFLMCTLALGMILWRVRKHMRRFRDTMEANLNDDAFQRMSDKYYYRKHRDDGPQFEDDYFSGGPSSAADHGQQRQSKQQQSTRRTTHTANGVTIIDDRDPNVAERKIFTHDEDDYVDFKET